MSEEMSAALIGIIGVLIGALVAYRLTIGNDVERRRATFRSKISEMKILAPKIENENFPAWFGKSQAAVERECCLVESAIETSKRNRFNTARAKYAAAQMSDIRDVDQCAFPRPMLESLMSYQIGNILVAETLQELIDCAA